LGLEISDPLVIQGCTRKWLSLRRDGRTTGNSTDLVSNVRAAPAWSFPRYAVQRSTWYHLSPQRENRHALDRFRTSENLEDRNRGTDPSGVVATVILPTFSAR